MRYTVTIQRIDLIGYIWQPGVGICAHSIDLSEHDLENINPKDRNEVACWLDTHTRDFSRIVDFRADFHIGDENTIHEWAEGEESEVRFSDAMFPDDS